MSSLLPFFIRNRALVNLALLFVLVGGWLSWQSIPQELFPVVDTDLVLIRTTYEAAPPAEVESQVTIPIEEEFLELSDVDAVTSTSKEGVSSLFIRLRPDTDVEDFLREAQSLLDAVEDLPQKADPPQLSRLRSRFPVISLSLFGRLSQARLQELAKQVRQRALELPGVASVEHVGRRDWELWVVVDPGDLSALGVSLDEVSRALRHNLPDSPGGVLHALDGDIRLRGQGVRPQPAEMERIVLRTGADGSQLRLGQVAQVELRLEEPVSYARFNGRPSINLSISKTRESSTIEVAKAVRQLGETLRTSLPPGVEVGFHSDLSKHIKIRLSTVKSTGMVGLLLLLLTLCLAFGVRAALLTGFGLPVAMLVTVMLIHHLGYTVNMVSLFAFLVVLGILVDDAIIVTESIYRRMEEGMAPAVAAEKGTLDVFWPVFVSTLTTIAAFLPMFAIGGIVGLFVEVIPVVVSCSLLVSLVEVFIVLPGHAAAFLRPSRRPPRPWRKKLLQTYLASLNWLLPRRYPFLVACIALLLFSLNYARVHLPYRMFGTVEVDEFHLNIETPGHYGLEETRRLGDRLEAAVYEVVEQHELKSLLTKVGISFIDPQTFKVGSNFLQLTLGLEKRSPRGFIERWVSPLFSWEESDGSRNSSTEDMVEAVRKRLEGMPGIKRLNVLRPQAGPPGSDVVVGISGPDDAVLRRQANDLRDFLRTLPGVYDVRHDIEPGKPEYRYTLNENGRRLGLTQEQLAQAVRIGFVGEELLKVSVEEERIPVRLIYPKSYRYGATDLSELPLVRNDGSTVYLGEIADVEYGRGLNEIRRRDGVRMARVYAEVDPQQSTPLQVTQRVEKDFTEAIQPGYRLLFLGERRETQESFADVGAAMLMSLAAIYFLLTALFRSLLDPLLIMLTIPLGMIGVVAGHALFGYNLQFLSVVGILALSGVIVNDTLILLDAVRRARAQGMNLHDALLEAGRVRVRPILLTTITTFLGMCPLIFFATGQTAFLAPMAVSLGFGIIAATFLTLYTLPCLYLIAHDLRNLLPHRLPASQ